MRKVLVISPHFDDAVLSVGQFLAGRPDTVVATVFSAVPSDEQMLTLYDDKCGFKSAAEAIAARRREDRQALALLKSEPRYLEYLDGQYGGDTTALDISIGITNAINSVKPEYVLGPLGLVHPDHEKVRKALLWASKAMKVPLWLYEDLPSRVTNPEAVNEALASIAAEGLTYESGFIGDGPLDVKLSALWCYRSQMALPEFDNIHNLCVPERFWRVGDAAA